MNDMGNMPEFSTLCIMTCTGGPVLEMLVTHFPHDNYYVLDPPFSIFNGYFRNKYKSQLYYHLFYRYKSIILTLSETFLSSTFHFFLEGEASWYIIVKF
jgi:hypothetical protein